MDYTPRLKKKYNDEIVSSLKGNYKSVMQVPKLVKIIINQGVGKGSSDEAAFRHLKLAGKASAQ